MILIADSGSTKTDWRVIDDDGSVREMSSEGMNPAWDDAQRLQDKLQAADVGILAPDEVWFYGAGVAGERRDTMEKALRRTFPQSSIFADSDMTGAARAVLGRKAGLVAILGTGMNSCLWSGEEIICGVPSLGFMLGDEGSGGSIGKALLRAWMRDCVPERLRDEVSMGIGMTKDEVMENVYRRSNPNRFCASFAKFVTDRQGKDGWYGELLASCFQPFFEDIICRYPGADSLPLGMVGSVAWSCRSMLEEMAVTYGINLTTVLRSPIDGLVAFHSAKLG